MDTSLVISQPFAWDSFAEMENGTYECPQPGVSDETHNAPRTSDFELTCSANLVCDADKWAVTVLAAMGIAASNVHVGTPCQLFGFPEEEDKAVPLGSQSSQQGHQTGIVQIASPHVPAEPQARDAAIPNINIPTTRAIARKICNPFIIATPAALLSLCVGLSCLFLGLIVAYASWRTEHQHGHISIDRPILKELCGSEMKTGIPDSDAYWCHRL